MRPRHVVSSLASRRVVIYFMDNDNNFTNTQLNELINILSDSILTEIFNKFNTDSRYEGEV